MPTVAQLLAEPQAEPAGDVVRGSFPTWPNRWREVMGADGMIRLERVGPPPPDKDKLPLLDFFRNKLAE